MPRKFTRSDVHPWKAVTRQGKLLRDKDGKPLNAFKGYADAMAVASKVGGTAVRA
ncbi:hypothetical protein SEA_ITER_32 [Arthrobacter phage Iter]|uniref:Uncharacterized protein n=1 Tax=Arthrobacter phage Ascela TaxID=3038360 RepID=A0AAF0GJA4_9CAUD|nr:hypothetical protein SEA_ITER_32 [Arthrobacter phage Iter]WGH21555.1 hypothetical protein SEA_ASCELA_32 [Arthrobacter phage Ascela]